MGLAVVGVLWYAAATAQQQATAESDPNADPFETPRSRAHSSPPFAFGSEPNLASVAFLDDDGRYDTR